MNWNSLTRRLEVAEKTVGIGRNDAAIPEAIDTLSVEVQALLRPYREARRLGTASDRDWPEGTHGAMHLYLLALGERTRLLREAGVPMLSVAETLRRRYGMRQVPSGTAAPEAI
jgi:hypothetical protein